VNGAAPAPEAGTLRRRLRGQRWIQRVVLLDSVDSTNDELRKLASEGAASGTVVLADHQRMGRGRRGRRWDSPKGLGLYLSVLFRPGGPTRDATRWTLAGAVAACEACRSLDAVGVEIQWPNDLVCEGRKLGGVLAEMRSQGQRATELILGVGINLSQRREEFPPDLARSATSLAEILGRGVDRLELAVRFLERVGNLANLLHQGAWDEVARRWDELAPSGRGRRVRLSRPAADGSTAVFLGTTQGLDDQGALRVLLDDGGTESIRLVESLELLES
jgi:BirA family biotin operon repressor/biotin-[acetyl-CoA-carboxylase] ligase